MSGWAPPPETGASVVDASGNGNTAAVLAAITGVDRKVDIAIVELRAICATVGDHEGRLRAVEKDGTTNREKWVGHVETHRTERSITAAVGTMATAIASAAGMLFGK